MRDITRPEVWAPNAATVELVVEGDPSPMARGARRGWWEASPLAPGTRYAFSLDGGPALPDPRSLSQPGGPHEPSAIVDPAIFRRPQWEGVALRGRPLYELHVGTFTDEGTFDAAIRRLDHLVDLGVAGVEVMPVADFPGVRGWGYDGTGLYSVHRAYGGPEGFVRFIDACHERGLGVVLDVVHNHLGPEGNFLAQFGPYFTSRHHTPWGAAINLDDVGATEVRRFLFEAVEQWIVDFQVDGLRLDAVHELRDGSDQHFLAELAGRAREWGRRVGRPLFITVESDLNQASMVSPVGSVRGARGMDAQWADDIHHALHAFFTGEQQGYYCDFGDVHVLGKALSSVFVHDGGHSTFRGREWGAPVELAGEHYDAQSFVVFIQNHDQVGNRASGDRLTDAPRQAAAAALYLLAPFTPMLFMGEEWAATTPFPFFSHLGDELGPLVSAGRAREFEAMGWQGTVPDPQAEATFRSAVLDWDERQRGGHRRMLDWYRTLLSLRSLLPGATDPSLAATRVEVVDDDTLVLHRPGFAVAATRSAGTTTVPLTGHLLAAWEAPERDTAGRWRLTGPGAIVVGL